MRSFFPCPILYQPRKLNAGNPYRTGILGIVITCCKRIGSYDGKAEEIMAFPCTRAWAAW